MTQAVNQNLRKLHMQKAASAEKSFAVWLWNGLKLRHFSTWVRLRADWKGARRAACAGATDVLRIVRIEALQKQSNAVYESTMEKKGRKWPFPDRFSDANAGLIQTMT